MPKSDPLCTHAQIMPKSDLVYPCRYCGKYIGACSTAVEAALLFAKHVEGLEIRCIGRTHPKTHDDEGRSGGAGESLPAAADRPTPKRPSAAKGLADSKLYVQQRAGTAGAIACAVASGTGMYDDVITQVQSSRLVTRRRVQDELSRGVHVGLWVRVGGYASASFQLTSKGDALVQALAKASTVDDHPVLTTPSLPGESSSSHPGESSLGKARRGSDAVSEGRVRATPRTPATQLPANPPSPPTVSEASTALARQFLHVERIRRVLRESDGGVDAVLRTLRARGLLEASVVLPDEAAEWASWRMRGHTHLGQLVVRRHQGRLVPGVVGIWLPPSSGTVDKESTPPPPLPPAWLEQDATMVRGEAASAVAQKEVVAVEKAVGVEEEEAFWVLDAEGEAEEIAEDEVRCAMAMLRFDSGLQAMLASGAVEAAEAAEMAEAAEVTEAIEVEGAAEVVEAEEAAEMAEVEVTDVRASRAVRRVAMRDCWLQRQSSVGSVRGVGSHRGDDGSGSGSYGGSGDGSGDNGSMANNSSSDGSGSGSSSSSSGGDGSGGGISSGSNSGIGAIGSSDSGFDGNGGAGNHLTSPSPPSPPSLEATLAKFGHSSFRRGQRAVIDALLSGKDVLVVWPTDSGKSLLYQLPAVHTRKVVVVYVKCMASNHLCPSDLSPLRRYPSEGWRSSLECM